MVVFCDGDFWHGRNWGRLREKLSKGSNAGYWVTKIAANRERDHRVTQELLYLGWDVVRVWEKDILNDVEGSAQEVASVVQNKLFPSIASQ